MLVNVVSSLESSKPEFSLWLSTVSLHCWIWSSFQWWKRRAAALKSSCESPQRRATWITWRFSLQIFWSGALSSVQRWLWRVFISYSVMLPLFGWLSYSSCTWHRPSRSHFYWASHLIQVRKKNLQDTDYDWYGVIKGFSCGFFDNMWLKILSVMSL